MATRKLYEHRCKECNRINEHYCYWEEDEQTCPECGGTATRIISAPRLAYAQMGVDDPDGFPTAADKWAKDTVRRHRQAGQSDQPHIEE